MIATFYIPKASLPYLLDHTVTGTVVRLGGHNIYHFEEDDNNIRLTKIEKKTDYIPKFYGEDIESLSAIVGKNGAGKTSILRQINYPIDQTSKGLLLVWEEVVEGNAIVKLINQTAKNVVANEEIEVVKTLDFANVLYYSPVIDFELKSARSSINPSSKFQTTLQDYYLKTLHQQTILLGNPITKNIISNYPDFPKYSSIEVKVHNFTKDYFRETYVLANFGNPNRGDALINEIEGDLRIMQNTEDSQFDLTREQFINRLQGYVKFLKADSFTHKLSQLWEIPDYQTEHTNDKIHNQNHLLKNLEVVLLSYLQSGAVFPMNGLGGPYNFDLLLSSKSFEEKLDQIASQYIVQRSTYIYDLLKHHPVPLSLQYHNYIVDAVKSVRIWYSPGNVDFSMVKKEIIQNIEDFAKIREFYLFIKEQYSDGSSLFFNLTTNLESFTAFNLKYTEIITILSKYSRKEAILFDFIPDRRLSNGEKSLLDLFASLYSYIIENKNNKQICKDNQVLILDEPELGYHPLWKKKFVLAITKVLPILFSELLPVKYDPEERIYKPTGKANPKLQVIFSTHDSLTLSDILFENVVFLDKNEADKTFISMDKRRTFGANVSDLLADSFFIENGLIGEFAKIKIDETINWLHSKENMHDSELRQLVIEKIDEPIIQRKLAQMFSEKMNTDLARILLEKELVAIQNKLKRM